VTSPSVAPSLRDILAARFRVAEAGQCSAPLTLFPRLAADIALDVIGPVLEAQAEEIARLRVALERKRSSEGEAP
jgi:hypothetical protein